MSKNIKEIAETIVRGTPVLTFPLKITQGTVTDQNHNRVLDIRGWGFLQYADNNEGAELQDGIGQWVVDTLNQAYENFVNEDEQKV